MNDIIEDPGAREVLARLNDRLYLSEAIADGKVDSLNSARAIAA